MVLEPSLGSRSWKSKSSTHIGSEYGLKIILASESLMYGFKYCHNTFNEDNEDSKLKDTEWSGEGLGLFLGTHFESFYGTVDFFLQDKISADHSSQYVSSTEIADLENVSLSGTGFGISIGTKLSENFTFSANYRRIKYTLQSQDSASDVTIDKSIQSLTLSIGYLFRLGGGL